MSDNKAPSRLRSIAMLTAVAAATAGMAWLKSGLEIDPENEAMKSIGTRQQVAMQRRIETFGADHFILVGLSSRDSSSIAASAVDRLIAELREVDGVTAAFPEPAATGTFRAVVVLLGDNQPGTGFASTVNRVRSTLDEIVPENTSAAITGQPAAEMAIADHMATEQRRIVPLVAVILVGLLMLIYRHPGITLAAAAPAGAGIAWTGGALALSGHRLDPVSSLMEPVILTIGVAGAVHVIEAYLRCRRAGSSPSEAARGSILELVYPATLTVLTTVAGFLALGAHDIPAVRRFGVYAALAASMTCLLTFLLTPVLLRLFDTPRMTSAPALSGSAASFSRRVARYAPAICLLFFILTLAAGFSWTRITVDTDPVSLLPEDSGFRRDFVRIADELGGIETFDILVPAASPAADPAFLGRLLNDLAIEPLVARMPAWMRRSPSGDLLVSPILAPSGTGARKKLFDRVEQRFHAAGAEDVLVTGTSVRVARDSDSLVRGQLGAFGIALGVLLAAGAFGFRSLRLAILGLLPNVVPCVIVYGVLATLGRPLSVASAMIGSVMLGLIVDDTIHFLYRYRQALDHQAHREEAVRSALAHAGRPIILTSVVLSGGFAACLAGSLVTTREFGLLSSSTILLALATDLLLLPAMLLLAPGPVPVAQITPPAPRLSPSRKFLLPLLPVLITLSFVLAHESWRETTSSRTSAVTGAEFVGSLTPIPSPPVTPTLPRR